METIFINSSYTYEMMQMDIEAVKEAYPFVEIISIGKSVLGKDLTVLKIGNGLKEVFYNAAIHANEWITAPVLMKFIQEYCLAIKTNVNIYGYNAKMLFDTVTLYVMPMVNPDGVNLVQGYISRKSSAFINAKAISQKYSNISFPNGWKANIEGIDLNLQFPALWDEAKRIKYEQGFTSPAPRDFVGFGPLSAPESLAIYNFTVSHNFKLVLCYHTQGKEIYWDFQNYAPAEAQNIGNIFSSVSGYTLTNPEFNSSFAGYKDWFLQEYKRPGYTIEAGFGQNPLPLNQFDEIYYDNIGILVLGIAIS